MRRAALLVALGVLAVPMLLAACGGDDGGGGEGVSSEPVRVYVGVDTAYAPFWVAQSEGLFEEEGLNVELVQFPQGGDGADALIAGEIDLGGSGDATILQRQPRGPLKALAVLQQSGDYLKLVVREEISSVEEIETIGIVPGSLSEYGATRMLEHFEIPQDSVEFVPAGPPELPPLISQGDVDAFVIWEPWPTQAEDLGGAKVLMRTKEFGYSYLFFLIANGDWYDGHQAEAEAFVRAMDQAAQMVEDDPQLAADVTQEAAEIPIDQSLTAVEQIDFDVRDFSDEDRVELERVNDFLVDRGILEAPASVDDLLVEGLAQ